VLLVTWIPVCVPVRVLVFVSVALSDCVPTVLNMALKRCTPLSAAVKV
jgi:hypothetical protein